MNEAQDRCSKTPGWFLLVPLLLVVASLLSAGVAFARLAPGGAASSEAHQSTSAHTQPSSGTGAGPAVPTPSPTYPPSTPPPACGLGWRIVSSPNPGFYGLFY